MSRPIGSKNKKPTPPEAISGGVRLLDISRPYAEIHGLPGALYEQDGFKFKSDGTEALDTSPYVEEEIIEDDDSEVPAVNIIEQQTSPEDKSSGETLDTMNEKTLKLLVGSYGEIWPGSKQAAISLLRGMNS